LLEAECRAGECGHYGQLWARGEREGGVGCREGGRGDEVVFVVECLDVEEEQGGGVERDSA